LGACFGLLVVVVAIVVVAVVVAASRVVVVALETEEVGGEYTAVDDAEGRTEALGETLWLVAIIGVVGKIGGGTTSFCYKIPIIDHNICTTMPIPSTNSARTLAIYCTAHLVEGLIPATVQFPFLSTLPVLL